MSAAVATEEYKIPKVMKEFMTSATDNLAKTNERLSQIEASLGRAAKTDEMLASMAKRVDAVGDVGKKLLLKFRAGAEPMRPEESAEQYIERTVGLKKKVSIGDGDLAAKVSVDRHAATLSVRYSRYMGVHGNNVSNALEHATRMGDKSMMDLLEDLAKNGQPGADIRDDVQAVKRFYIKRYGTMLASSGGVMIPVALADEFIPLLAADNVLRRFAGIKITQMPFGNLDIPRVNAGPTGGYYKEGTGPRASDLGTDKLTAKAHRLMALVSRTNEISDFSSYDIDAQIADALLKKAGEDECLTFIRGDGSLDTPLGLRYWVEQYAPAQIFDRTLNGSSVPDRNTIMQDLLNAMYLVENNKIRVDRGGWILGTKAKYALLGQMTDVGALIFAPEMRAGTLLGAQWESTPLMPDTLAGDGDGNGTNNKSEIYFAAMDQLRICQVGAVDVRTFPGGTYTDADGNTRSGITDNSDVVRLISYNDFIDDRKGLSAAVIESVDWIGGAGV